MAKRLNRARIAQKALEIVDKEGLDRLTMRRLGSELGVEGMSLYHYFGSKNELLDAVLEQVIMEVDLLPDEEDWIERIRGIHISFRDALRRHPRALPVVAVRPFNTDRTLLLPETVLGVLLEAGLDEVDSMHGYRALKAYVTGYALTEAAGFIGEDVYEGQKSGSPRERLDPRVFPNLLRATAGDGSRDHDAEFAAGLQDFLSGLQLQLDAQPRGLVGP